ncbi:MAG: branched-chain amino acid ABC transporter substrate-binding protein [Gammaproteobacteria bacterium]|nr:branched-chain amino acid ABC transporter substrate-binding protein [Gammaproteobacteria bacterium]
MKILKLFLGVLVAGLLVSCSQQDSSSSDSSSASELKIGIAGPHTGAYAAFGEQLWEGAIQAIEDINAAGGINGAMLVAVKGDDACEPKQAVNVANRLIEQDEVVGVIGHFCSSSTIPASEIYYDADVIDITPASTNPTVTDRGLDIMMRICGRDDQQGIVAGDYVADVLNGQRVVVIHDKDTYGQGLADATRAQLDARGVNVVLYEGLTRGEKDFNALVTKVRALSPDVVYFGGLHTEAGPLLRQLREQGVDAWFISGDGIVSDDFVKAAGSPEFLTKTLMTFGADPRNSESNPAGAEVVKQFRDQGYEPEGYTLYSYAAVQTLAAALIANPGETSGGLLADWIKDNGADTVLGRKEFDSKGDLKVSDYVMYRWNTDGTYNEL